MIVGTQKKWHHENNSRLFFKHKYSNKTYQYWFEMNESKRIWISVQFFSLKKRLGTWGNRPKSNDKIFQLGNDCYCLQKKGETGTGGKS